ncbi:MAG TPA: thioredoxin family protein [Flavobacteriaceae bacterium]|nr:thioredoxin family protein [Flavobacteriaceae bacterium]
MAKFGDLIDNEVPVLIEFYKTGKDNSTSESVLTTVAQRLKEKTRVVRIDIKKNMQLAEALKIEALPTLVIYQKGEMVWRKSGFLSAQDLISELKKLM